VMPPWLARLLATSCGLIVANIYYAQPLAGPISASLGLSLHAAGLIVTLTQMRPSRMRGVRGNCLTDMQPEAAHSRKGLPFEGDGSPCRSAARGCFPRNLIRRHTRKEWNGVRWLMGGADAVARHAGADRGGRQRGGA
jgi:hypothetical protein